MMPTLTEARLAYNAGGIGVGTYVWDNVDNQWSRHAYSTGLDSLDAVYWSGGSRYVRLGTDNIVYGENATHTEIITAGWSTGWIRPSDAFDAYQRVWRLILVGTYRGASSLQVTASYDFGDGTQGAKSITISDTSVLATAGAGSSWQLRWHLPVQKCSAIAFSILDNPLVAGAGGLDFSGMTLEIGVRPGARKLPAVQSA